jgi:hypothetical protein
MKRRLAVAAIAAIAGLVAVGLSTTAADAVNIPDMRYKPDMRYAATTTLEPVACSGRRREYKDFAQCMRVNKGSSAAKYCSKIC